MGSGSVRISGIGVGWCGRLLDPGVVAPHTVSRDEHVASPNLLHRLGQNIDAEIGRCLSGNDVQQEIGAVIAGINGCFR